MTEQRQEVYRRATELFAKEPDWATFYREILGVDGIVRRLYREAADLAQFEQSEEYRKIQQMVAKLREKEADAIDSPKDSTRVITVRMPKCLHESLKAEAHDMHISMNKLCISKLLQVVDEELVPNNLVAAMAE